MGAGAVYVSPTAGFWHAMGREIILATYAAAHTRTMQVAMRNGKHSLQKRIARELSKASIQVRSGWESSSNRFVTPDASHPHCTSTQNAETAPIHSISHGMATAMRRKIITGTANHALVRIHTSHGVRQQPQPRACSSSNGSGNSAGTSWRTLMGGIAKTRVRRQMVAHREKVNVRVVACVSLCRHVRGFRLTICGVHQVHTHDQRGIDPMAHERLVR